MFYSDIVKIAVKNGWLVNVKVSDDNSFLFDFSEWIEASGKFSPTRFCQAVADMYEIRTQAFLLAIELAEAVEDNDYFIFFPWFQWN